MSKSLTYKDSGVDVDLGNVCSKIMYESSKKTWENNEDFKVRTPYDAFSGSRSIDISNLKRNMGANADGVGTKIEIAERLSSYTKDFSYHQDIAFDLFAMVCDDAAIKGASPITVITTLDVNKLNKELIENLAKGQIAAAEKAGVSVINGETAELGSRVNGYGEFCYDWGAVAIWFAEEGKLITGHDVKPGNYIVGLREYGFRSNGISLVRKIMGKKYGKKWHKKRFDLARQALTPSIIYTKAVLEMNDNSLLKAASHITGGGIPEKLGRALEPSGYGAHLDPFEPSDLMLKCQEWGNVQDKEAYRTWNMGTGMLLVTAKDNIDEVIKIAEKHDMEAKMLGRVSLNKKIIIKNKGYFRKKVELEF